MNSMLLVLKLTTQLTCTRCDKQHCPFDGTEAWDTARHWAFPQTTAQGRCFQLWNHMTALPEVAQSFPCSATAF